MDGTETAIPETIENSHGDKNNPIVWGHGIEFDCRRGTTRSWTLGRDGVKRWTDTDEPVIGVVRQERAEFESHQQAQLAIQRAESDRIEKERADLEERLADAERLRLKDIETAAKNEDKKPKMLMAGRFTLLHTEGEEIEMSLGLVIQFDSAESLRAALLSGMVSFERS